MCKSSSITGTIYTEWPSRCNQLKPILPSTCGKLPYGANVVVATKFPLVCSTSNKTIYTTSTWLRTSLPFPATKLRMNANPKTSTSPYPFWWHNPFQDLLDEDGVMVASSLLTPTPAGGAHMHSPVIMVLGAPWHHTIYLICMKLETSTRKLRRFFLNLCLFSRSSELERLFELVRLWKAVASLDFMVGFCCFSSNSWTNLWYSSCSQNNKGSKASAAWPANSNLKSSKRRICRRILKKWLEMLSCTLPPDPSDSISCEFNPPLPPSLSLKWYEARAFTAVRHLSTTSVSCNRPKRKKSELYQLEE